MAVADDVARLTSLMWSVHREQQFFGPLLGPGRRGLGRVAKASGATPGQVESWMRGECEPTTQQALAALTAMRTSPAAVLNGAGR